METNRLKDGKGTEGRKVEKGENRRDKWNWGYEERGDRWLFYGKREREGRQMRMRLTKGLERGDRWEEGQRMVTDGIKDDKGVRKRE